MTGVRVECSLRREKLERRAPSLQEARPRGCVGAVLHQGPLLRRARRISGNGRQQRRTQPLRWNDEDSGVHRRSRLLGAYRLSELILRRSRTSISNGRTRMGRFAFLRPKVCHPRPENWNESD